MDRPIPRYPSYAREPQHEHEPEHLSQEARNLGIHLQRQNAELLRAQAAARAKEAAIVAQRQRNLDQADAQFALAAEAEHREKELQKWLAVGGTPENFAEEWPRMWKAELRRRVESYHQDVRAKLAEMGMKEEYIL